MKRHSYKVWSMSKDISINNRDLPEPEDDMEENTEKKKEWKDIINLPDDLDFEMH